MNNSSEQLSGQPVFPFHTGAKEVKTDAAIASEDRYGLSRIEYEVYLEDCKESKRMCADAHRYLLNNPDVLANFF